MNTKWLWNLSYLSRNEPLQVRCSEQHLITKLKGYTRNELPKCQKKKTKQNTIKLHEHIVEIPLAISPALSLFPWPSPIFSRWFLGTNYWRANTLNLTYRCFAWFSSTSLTSGWLQNFSLTEFWLWWIVTMGHSQVGRTSSNTLTLTLPQMRHTYTLCWYMDSC